MPKKKKTHYLTAEEILELPDAPIGQRARDIPPSKEELEIVDEAREQITRIYDDRYILEAEHRLYDGVKRAVDKIQARAEQEFPRIQASLEQFRVQPLSRTASALQKVLNTQKPNGLTLEQQTGSFTAVLNGKIYPLTKQQFEILKKLEAAKGGWVASGDLKTSNKSQERPDKIISRLPQQIQRKIKAKAGHGGGFRIVL